MCLIASSGFALFAGALGKAVEEPLSSLEGEALIDDVDS